MKKSRSIYTDLTRVSRSNLEWIKENKDTRTTAGYLDKIINKYKDDKKRGL